MSFDHFALNEPEHNYYTWFEPSPDGTPRNIWASGNPGFWLSRSDARPEAYPTSVSPDGRTGSALRLVTQSTGELGAASANPLRPAISSSAPRSGECLLNPLAATRFGTPVNRIPTRFSGYYKWQPGAVFTDAQGQKATGPAADGKTRRASTPWSIATSIPRDSLSLSTAATCSSSPFVVAVALLDDLS